MLGKVMMHKKDRYRIQHKELMTEIVYYQCAADIFDHL